MKSMARIVRAATGNTLTTQGWQQEAALRMLYNNLDPSVAEHPEELIVYVAAEKPPETGRALML